MQTDCDPRSGSNHDWPLAGGAHTLPAFESVRSAYARDAIREGRLETAEYPAADATAVFRELDAVRTAMMSKG